MIPQNLKIGDTFEDGGRIYEVTKIVPNIGYESKVIEGKKPAKEEKEEKQLDSFNSYTKTEINRLNNAELEKVCEQLGLEKGTGMAMKKAIIDKLGL